MTTAAVGHGWVRHEGASVGAWAEHARVCGAPPMREGAAGGVRAGAASCQGTTHLLPLPTLLNSMMRQTGGCASGTTRIRSMPRLRASASASAVAITPSGDLSSASTRTSGTLQGHGGAAGMAVGA